MKNLLFGATLLGGVTAAGSVQAGDAPSCGLDESQTQTRVALAKTLVGKHLRKSKKITDGYQLTIAVDGVADVVQLVLLERLCCADVTSKLEIPPSGDVAVLSITGPESFQKEIADLLAHRKK